MTNNLSLSHNCSEDAEGFTLEGSWIVLKLCVSWWTQRKQQCDLFEGRATDSVYHLSAVMSKL